MDEPLLTIRSLTAGYGARTVLHGLSLEVPDRTILALFGHNGAGKSTLLKALFGLLRTQSGEVHFLGRPITNRPPARNVRDGIGLVPQGGGIFPDLTIDENLLVAYQVTGACETLFPQARAQVIEIFPRLSLLRRQRAGALSGGEQRMLALGMALIRRPRLLLLDEPSIGLSPSAAQALFGALTAINRELGITLMVAEQNIRLALEICSQVCVLRLGQVAWAGSPGAPGMRSAVEIVQLL